MSISACIISKNEEKNIERCLRSLKNAVDEIILVDTGSTDNTINIAKNFDVKIYTMEWQDDFSKARNYSLDKATKEWILIIDCDEELDKKSIPLLRDLSTNKSFEAFGVIISNVIGGFESYSTQSLRLMRNKKEYRFHSPIHEQVGDVITAHKGPYSVLSSKIKLIHYGYEYDEELELLKTARNLRILNNVKEEERDSLYYLHLANEYSRLNDFLNAKDLYLKSEELATENSPHYTQLCHKIMDTLVKLKEFELAIKYGEKFLTKFPDFKAILFLYSICNIEVKNYKNAAIYLKKFKNEKDSLSKYPNVNYEENNDIDKLIKQLENIINR